MDFLLKNQFEDLELKIDKLLQCLSQLQNEKVELQSKLNESTNVINLLEEKHKLAVKKNENYYWTLTGRIVLSEIKIEEVRILGKSFKIKCSENESSDLHAAVDYINNSFSKSNKKNFNNNNFEKLSILLSLNLYQQVLQLKRQNKEIQKNLSQHLQDVDGKIDTILSQFEKIEV